MNIALIKKGMMGDLIMVTPAIRRFKILYPNHNIYIFTDERLHPLFYKNTYISGLNKNIKYDKIIDFKNKYNPTNYENKINFYFKYINKSFNLKLNDLNDEDYQYDLICDLPNPNLGKYALFSPLCAGKWKGRNLINTIPYLKLKEKLEDDGYLTVEIPYEKRVWGKCHLTLPPCSLSQFINLVKHANLIVTVDTGTLHIAQAFKKSTISIFGKVPPESRLIPKNNVTVVKKEIPCIGCFAKIADPYFCDNNEDCMYLNDDALLNAYLSIKKI